MTVTDPTKLSVGSLSRFRADGTPVWKLGSDGSPAVNSEIYPERLIFRPTALARLPRKSRRDFRIELATLAPGIQLYDVYAQETLDSEPEKVGTLELQSAFVASRFADDHLFFKHESHFLRK
jgi:hypothetical protein